MPPKPAASSVLFDLSGKKLPEKELWKIWLVTTHQKTALPSNGRRDSNLLFYVCLPQSTNMIRAVVMGRIWTGVMEANRTGEFLHTIDNDREYDNGPHGVKDVTPFGRVVDVYKQSLLDWMHTVKNCAGVYLKNLFLGTKKPKEPRRPKRGANQTPAQFAMAQENYTRATRAWEALCEERSAYARPRKLLNLSDALYRSLRGPTKMFTSGRQPWGGAEKSELGKRSRFNSHDWQVPLQYVRFESTQLFESRFTRKPVVWVLGFRGARPQVRSPRVVHRRRQQRMC